MEEHTSSDIAKTFPYVSYVTFSNALASLAEHGLPPTIDKSVLNKFSGANQNLLLSAFRFLGFIDNNDVPEQSFHMYQSSDTGTRKTLLGSFIKEHYPNQTKILTTGTHQQLKDSFNNSSVKPSVKAKCLSFFLGAAKASGFTISNYIQKGMRERAPGGPKKKKVKDSQKDPKPAVKDLKEPQIPETMVCVPIAVGIGKTWQIIIEKSPTPEQKERFVQMVKLALEI